MDAKLAVVVICWLLYGVVLVLALGINEHNGRNDLGCRGLFGPQGQVWVGATDEDKLDADGDGTGCEANGRS